MQTLIWMRAGACAIALASTAAESQTGTLIVAHGADSAWNARVLRVASEARTGGPVEVSFLMGAAAAKSRFQDAIARLEQRGVSSIVVVPMLVSSYSGHYEQLRFLTGDTSDLDHVMRHHLEMSGIERPKARVPIRLARAMDDAPQVARVVTDRALALSANPTERAVLILGHGPNSAEDYAHWMDHLRRVADSVKTWGRFRDVRVELVRDDAPQHVRAEAVRRARELVELQRMATGQDVLVVPLLVSRGASVNDRFARDVAGLPIVYGGDPLLPHPALARWIEDRVRQVPGG